MPSAEAASRQSGRKKGSQYCVTEKIRFAPRRAAVRLGRSSMSARTSSAPRRARDCAAGEEGLRVMARTWYDLEGRERKCRATEPPWFPVAPRIAMIFFFGLEEGVVVVVVLVIFGRWWWVVFLVLGCCCCRRRRRRCQVLGVGI